jgi:cytochrome c peroxidase
LGLAILGLGGTLTLPANERIPCVPFATVTVTIEHRWGAAPISFHHVCLTNAAGNVLSVTRLSYLISGIRLHASSGEIVKVDRQFAFLNPVEGRSSFTISNVPAGQFTNISFNVGLSAAVNHGDPGVWAGKHPLNPNVNGLHWSWQQGYVFFALEGHYLQPDGAISAYSYHIANDACLINASSSINLNVFSENQVALVLQVDRVFNAATNIKLENATSSTHSRPGDALAGMLRTNAEGAFTADAAPRPVPPASDPGRMAFPGGHSKQIIASNATPYRLRLASYFPRPDLPADNPLTDEGVALGRQLFFEPRLSRNNYQSCASCHGLRAAGADPGKRFSRGVAGRAGRRNSMPLFNLAWKRSFFWDGRAKSLREQVLMPIEDPNEMAESITNVVAKLAATTRYPALFQQAFGTRRISGDLLARALEQFLLTQISDDAKFDRALRGEVELNEVEKRGFELFVTEYDPRRRQFGADCFHCHGGPLFVNTPFANNGLALVADDPGRFLATRLAADEGKFATPSLRNVAITAPYMHDGRFQTLEEVLEHYSSGVRRTGTLDPNLAKHPPMGIQLGAEDKQALVAFLKTLTDARYSHTGIYPETAGNPAGIPN